MSSKVRSSFIFSCCFRSSTVNLHGDGGDLPPTPFPDLKDRHKTLISRIGRHCHRRNQSADFRYDPLSYALNFDEGNGDFVDIDDEKEFHYRNFSSRLPASPQAPPTRSPGEAAVGVACS